jgi:ribokinase
MPILNLGSLNIDRVFRVPHIVRHGETIGSTSFDLVAGGKGANQSVALARAGGQVLHAGKVGPDGAWLVEKLAGEGIDTRWIRIGSAPTGQAVIQVDQRGENAIVLYPGANREITCKEVDEALDTVPPGTWLLVQNETSGVAHAICSARHRGLPVAFNPAPCDGDVLQDAWEQVDLLCVNEREGAALARDADPAQIIDTLSARAPQCEIVLTLGAEGVWYRYGRTDIRLPAVHVSAVDTTAAGDTFLGYYLAFRVQGRAPRECLEAATRAAALCVTRPGALDSIPRRGEVFLAD